VCKILELPPFFSLAWPWLETSEFFLHSGVRYPHMYAFATEIMQIRCNCSYGAFPCFSYAWICPWFLHLEFLISGGLRLPKRHTCEVYTSHWYHWFASMAVLGWNTCRTPDFGFALPVYHDELSPSYYYMFKCLNSYSRMTFVEIEWGWESSVWERMGIGMNHETQQTCFRPIIETAVSIDGAWPSINMVNFSCHNL